MNLKYYQNCGKGKPSIMGLKSATQEEIQKVKDTLDSMGVPWKHKTHYGSSSIPLPYNGVLQVNMRTK